MRVPLPVWTHQLPEPLLLGALLFVLLVTTAILAGAAYWLRNACRLVPDRVTPADVGKAVLFYVFLSLALACGATLGAAILAPLHRIGPHVAALPGAILVVVFAGIALTRRLSRRS